MKRTDVDSSMLASVGYDEKTKTLEAEFNSGTVYQYFDVEKEIFEELMNADSHGRYFSNNIRNVFEIYAGQLKSQTSKLMNMEFRDYVPTRVLHDFVGRIEPLGIKYMLTGSMAMMRYAAFRQTADIDIVLEFDSDVKDKFIKVLEPDYYVPQTAVVRAFETKRMFNVIHIETAFKIDCVPKKSSEFQQSAFERREKTDYYGREIWIISKEDLILSKLWWAKDTNSEMQFKDIKSIMLSGFDKDYAEQWIDKLGVRESYIKCLNEVKN